MDRFTGRGSLLEETEVNAAKFASFTTSAMPTWPPDGPTSPSSPDFNFAPTQGSAPDPNLPAAGKRPRSSMSPTIVLRDGKPVLAVGSPGGATIITTVLQILVNRIDLGMTLPQALTAPRMSQRNTAKTDAEPAYLAQPSAKGLLALGQSFNQVDEIGTAAGLEFLPHGKILAVGEPTRRGGTAAAVVSRR